MAATVTPDPVGSFLGAYQAADTSYRDRQRLAMQAQQMAENAVQRARENKANDFKLMLSALSSQTDDEWKRYQMEKGDDSLKVQAYNAQTSRYNALNNRGSSRTSTYSDDPLGLAGGGGGGAALPSEPRAIMPPPVLPGDSGDFMPAPGQDQGTFGDDLPAAAGAVPDYTLFPTVPPPIPDGEEGPTGPAGPAPAAAVPPRAAPMAEPVTAPQVPRANPIPEIVEEQVAVETPARDLNSQETLRAFMGNGIPEVPAAPAAEEGTPLLPPPVVVPSFTDQDVSTAARGSVIELEGKSKEEARRAAILQAKANRTAGYLGRANLRDPAAYRALAEQEQAAAIDAAGKANEAAAEAATLKSELPKLQKRQELLTSLTDLETVMPPNETAALIATAADPVKGGAADRQLSILSAYQKVRQERGLDHKSRGLATAENVARAGANLYTKDAQDDRQAFDAYTTAKAALAAGEEDPDAAKAWRTEVIKNTARAQAWMSREKTFNEAVRRDTMPDAPVAEEVTVTPVVPAAAAVARPVDIVTQANEAAAKGAPMSPEDQKYWTQSKNVVLESLGGRQGIIDYAAENGKQIKDERDLKEVLKMMGLVARANGVWSEGMLPKMPKGANNAVNITDALAADLWAATGRPKDGKAVPGAPAVNPASRSAIDALKAKIDSTR